VHHSKSQTASSGIQTRLAAPGGRTRATSTCTTTVRHQITPGHTPEIHPTSGTEH
jgi:hypothetical protein